MTPAMATSIQFRTVDVPGAAQTEVNGVNNPGVVAGTYIGQNGVFGFIQDGSKLVTLDYPGTSGVTTVASINNPGTVIGYYTDASNVAHGWIRSPGGSFSPINDPAAGSAGGEGTLPFGINDSGTVVGGYIDANGTFHGFIDQNGTFTTVDAPQAGTGQGQGTYLDAVNASGAIAGTYIDANALYHGFVDTKGVISPFQAPGSTGPGEGGTSPSGISSNGDLDGYYGNGTVYQGWLDVRGQFTSLNDPQAGPAGTEVYGLSQNGKTACGFYFDADGNLHGFVATISP